MQARIRLRSAAVSVASFLFLTGLAWDTFASPIELENSADAGWADAPNCNLAPALCHPLVVGAPRLVPDMSNAGSLLQFLLDFHAVSVTNFRFPSSLPSFLALNIADANGNDVFRPSQDTPLQLIKFIATSSPNPNGPGFLPASDLIFDLGSFESFDLLPAGDLLFTVTLSLQLGLPFNQTFDRNNNGRTEAATLTITGPGTVVPEPDTLVLLLAGLASILLKRTRAT